MGYGDYYWGLHRDYYRDPLPHSLPSTRQSSGYDSIEFDPGDGQEVIVYCSSQAGAYSA